MDFFEYTPALQKPETLETTLAGRNIEIKNIVRILKNASSGKSSSHPLLVGPKGIGKTHLLQVINHAVKGSIKAQGIKRLGKYFIPVIFPEEEYVDNIKQFVTQILLYLPENEKKIFSAIEELISTPSINEKAKETAISFLESFKKKTGKKLLLLIDNFNDILESFTEEDQSILRKVLMSSDSVLFIGATPTLFESIINHDKPFYNFFEIIWLRDLPFEEAKSLLRSYAELEKKDKLIKKIDKSEAKLRAIHELTGGNPRLILRLYHIISEGDIASVEKSLLKLLDGLSPYFRERIRDLSDQQRKIIDVMARSDNLLTPTEIANHCHLPINTVNSQIKRLEQMGYIKKPPQIKKKRVLYDINERLFCLWRQMRVEAGRKRVGFISRFLEIWFTKEELFQNLDKTLSEMHKYLSCDYITFQSCVDKLWYLKEAINELKDKDEICVACKRKEYDVALEIVSKALKSDPKNTDMLHRKGCIYLAENKYEKAIKAFKKLIAIDPKNYNFWVSLGNTYMEQKEFKNAIASYKKGLNLKPDSSKILNNIGIVYGSLGETNKAIATFKKAIEVDQQNPMIMVNLGTAFMEQKRFNKAIVFFINAKKLDPKNYLVWLFLGNAYSQLKNYDKAIEAFKIVLKIKPKHYAAWNELGINYDKNGQIIKAIKTFKHILKNNADEYSAWINLGFAYRHDKKYEKEIQTLKKAIEINAEEFIAWNRLAEAYFDLKLYEEAKHAFTKALKIGSECDCALKNILLIFRITYLKEGLKGNIEIACKNLKELLDILAYSNDKEIIYDFFVSSLKTMVKRKGLDLIKITLKEIKSADQGELLEFLSPFSKLIQYLDSKDMDNIERLRKEDRKIVEEMLKELGEKKI